MCYLVMLVFNYRQICFDARKQLNTCNKSIQLCCLKQKPTLFILNTEISTEDYTLKTKANNPSLSKFKGLTSHRFT